MPADQNPNVKGRSGDAYLRSSVVTFASLRRWNPGASLVFATTEMPGEVWQHQLARLGVQPRIISFDHRPPDGFARTFMGSLYLLDVLEKMQSDYLLLVDPDVFCIGPLDAVLSPEAPLRALLIPSPRGEKINGLSPSDADAVHAELGEPREVDYHYGGEFYGIPFSMRNEILDRVARAWEHALANWSTGRAYFTTEEHVMNFALATLDPAVSSHLVRRIWTAHSHRTVAGDEENLLLWHLPSEKDRGFRNLYDAATNMSSWFWNANRQDFIQIAGRAFGFHHRGAKRLLLDCAGFMKAKFAKGSRS